MNYLKKWWTDRVAKREEEITQIIRDEFRVVEKSGILFLTHNGVAFEQIAGDAPASEIAGKLNTARNVAQTYRTL